LETALRGAGVERTARATPAREENRKLKTLVADLTLDKHILQEVKKSLKPAARRELVRGWAALVPEG
jgi:hypothetical protein